LQEVAEKFPAEIDNLRRLIDKIKTFNEVSLDNEFLPAKVVVRQFIANESLVEMIFCPLLIYGSAWENDMDFSQFVIMFKSIFLEGFSRPKGGVRTIINLLKDRYERLGGEIRFKSGVKNIISSDLKVSALILDNDEVVETETILSSAGLPETMQMCNQENAEAIRIGNLSFTESILITAHKPQSFKQDATIIFYNNRPHYAYQRSIDFIDSESAVICLPNNFKFDDASEGIMRVTNIANFEKWNQLARPEYLEQKDLVFKNAQKTLQKFLPGYSGDFLFKDVFSPTTVKRYTGHLGGAVYGSPDKSRNGKTHLNGLYIMGTDQGFLGIVGAMLSGISIANLYGLMEQK
jgi:phytoene dehydrogenase-like protein